MGRYINESFRKTVPSGTYLEWLLVNDKVRPEADEELGTVDESTFCDALALYRATNNIPSYEELRSTVERYHTNGHDPIRDLGIDVVAMVLSPKDYGRLMKFVRKLGTVAPRRRKASRRRR